MMRLRPLLTSRVSSSLPPMNSPRLSTLTLTLQPPSPGTTEHVQASVAIMFTAVPGSVELCMTAVTWARIRFGAMCFRAGDKLVSVKVGSCAIARGLICHERQTNSQTVLVYTGAEVRATKQQGRRVSRTSANAAAMYPMS
jgi:hypothetical protein